MTHIGQKFCLGLGGVFGNDNGFPQLLGTLVDGPLQRPGQFPQRIAGLNQGPVAGLKFVGIPPDLPVGTGGR